MPKNLLNSTRKYDVKKIENQDTLDTPTDPELLKAKSLNELEACLAASISNFINGNVEIKTNEFAFDQSNVDQMTGKKGGATINVKVKSKKLIQEKD